MALFNRISSLEIGEAGKQGFLFSDFRITFDIVKTDSTEPNTASVNIFNLNAKTRSDISRKNQVLTLKAGYVEELGEEVVYVGDVNKVSDSFSLPEIITNFECGDGEKILNNLKSSVSYKPGTSVQQILKNEIKNAGVALKTNLNLVKIKNFVFNNGFNFTGMFKTLVTKLSDTGELKWSIQNNELKLYPFEGNDLSLAIVLNINSGLIGSPEKIKIKKGLRKKKTEFDGWKITSLLQPKAEPGGIIIVSSRDIGNNKRFKIDRVQHSGDTHEGEFKTILEVISNE